MDSDPRIPVLFIDTRIHWGGDCQGLLDRVSGLDKSRFRPFAACTPFGILGKRVAGIEGVEHIQVSYGQLPPSLDWDPPPLRRWRQWLRETLCTGFS